MQSAASKAMKGFVEIMVLGRPGDSAALLKVNSKLGLLSPKQVLLFKSQHSSALEALMKEDKAEQAATLLLQLSMGKSTKLIE